MGQQQSEKSVFSRGLKFVPISKKADEFSVKQDLEKFLRRVQLKAFFHDKEDDSNTSNKDTFETLQIRKSKWTPPEGQFAPLDFSIKKCRHSINKLKFLTITTPRTLCIYFLPKIHKPNNPGRHIVSACSCPTELISSNLDKIMAPIVKTLSFYIKDSQHALEIFQ